MYTITQIESLIDIPEDPVGKCQKIVNEISYTLARNDIEHDNVEGTFFAFEIDEGMGEAYHWYIKINDDQIKNIDGDVIVDPTIEQFSIDNYNNDRVTAYVPESHISSGPIIKKSNPLYEAYKEK